MRLARWRLPPFGNGHPPRVKDRGQTPTHKVPTIKAYPEGQFIVRGPVQIIDEEGRPIEIRRAVVPLCRCGRSRTKPLCDGTHQAAASKERRAVSLAQREG
jgi:CDGSH-type Zn-finger protein